MRVASHCFQLPLRLVEIRVYFQSRLKLRSSLLGPPHVPQDFPQLVMGHIIVGTESETATVKGDRFMRLSRCLRLLKVSKRTVAVLSFLLLPLPSQNKPLDLLPLAHDLLLLAANLLLLLADQLRLAGGEEK